MRESTGVFQSLHFSSVSQKCQSKRLNSLDRWPTVVLLLPQSVGQGHSSQLATISLIAVKDGKWKHKRDRCYDAKIEESEKAVSRRNRTQDIWLVQPVLCHWAMTTGQSPALTILCMCHQKSVRGWPENSLHQERTHAEWSSQSKCLELLPHVGIKRIQMLWGKNRGRQLSPDEDNYPVNP